MKQTLNIWMVILAAMLALGLVTGCGGGSDDDSSSAAATADSSGGTTDAAAPAADAADDAADADDSAAATFDFTTQTPQNLTATKGAIGFLQPIEVTLSCGAIKTATSYTFTTDLGTSQRVNAPSRSVVVTVQLAEQGQKIRYSVYAVNAAGEQTKTASSSFSTP